MKCLLILVLFGFARFGGGENSNKRNDISSAMVVPQGGPWAADRKQPEKNDAGQQQVNEWTKASLCGAALQLGRIGCGH
jgi:hypothetical protein